MECRTPPLAEGRYRVAVGETVVSRLRVADDVWTSERVCLGTTGAP
jgi:hypothetical protein